MMTTAELYAAYLVACEGRNSLEVRAEFRVRYPYLWRGVQARLVAEATR